MTQNEVKDYVGSLKVGRRSIFSFTSKDRLSQASLFGVYFNGGDIVASDAHILVRMKAVSYDGSLEGHVVYKDGSFADSRYPGCASLFTPSIVASRIVDAVDLSRMCMLLEQGAFKLESERQLSTMLKVMEQCKLRLLELTSSGVLYSSSSDIDIMVQIKYPDKVQKLLFN